MFFNQCNVCNERWEAGTAPTCKCPDEPSTEGEYYPIPLDKTAEMAIGNIKPNYNMTFHRDGKQIGVLDFNGPEMVFSGDMDESAKVFFGLIAKRFEGRLKEEREALKVEELGMVGYGTLAIAAAIRKGDQE